MTAAVGSIRSCNSCSLVVVFVFVVGVLVGVVVVLEVVLVVVVVVMSVVILVNPDSSSLGVMSSI